MKSSKKNQESVNATNNVASEELKWHTCSITGKRYQGYGNNAWPFEGRCCDEANLRYVIPARIIGTTPEKIKKCGNKKWAKWMDFLLIPERYGIKKQVGAN